METKSIIRSCGFATANRYGTGRATAL